MSAGRSQTNPRDSPPMKRQVKRGNLGSTCRLSSLLQGFSQPLQRLCVGAIGPLVVLEGLRQPPCPQKQRQVFKAPARDCLFCSTWGSGVTACPPPPGGRSPGSCKVPQTKQGPKGAPAKQQSLETPRLDPGRFRAPRPPVPTHPPAQNDDCLPHWKPRKRPSTSHQVGGACSRTAPLNPLERDNRYLYRKAWCPSRTEVCEAVSSASSGYTRAGDSPGSPSASPGKPPAPLLLRPTCKEGEGTPPHMWPLQGRCQL